MNAMSPGKTQWKLFILLLSVQVALVVFLLAVQPASDPLSGIVRAAGVIGYFCSFLAIASSAFKKKIAKMTGKPFLGIHHLFAVTAISMMLMHVGALLLITGDPSMLLPHFASLEGFFVLGGRLALPMFLVAGITARFAGSIKYWKALHLLNYTAFFLGTTHAIMIGQDFQWTSMKVAAIVLCAATLGIFATKHILRNRKAA